MRTSIKTTKKQILNYHYEHTDECGMGSDADEWHHRCWRCGYIRSLERCHIVPDSVNGKDIPSNYVLLCNDCHLENPNVKDTTEMWKWIRSTSSPMYDTFWEIRNTMKEVISETTDHFGETMNESTKKWVSSEFIKRLQIKGIFPNMIPNLINILKQ